ncbi:MAG: RNA 3'-terminal phosphate cyclase [Chromatiales bacterium]|nr:RNA 3'-terminal phosphate cyclase [Chromatiales bacterium]
MVVIDGSQGEGGGQILRTALSLSMVTGKALRIENIRAKRPKPGLMRQHLTCVQAAQAISSADVSGVELGSTAITFVPKAIKAGNYHFAVGTAGSTTLVFQTVLPALMLADAESTLSFEGGTHNLSAPTFDFITLAYLPALKRMGIEVGAQIERHGFYPQGGGRWQAVIKPVSGFQRLDLLSAGPLLKREAVVTTANIPGHVAQRELGQVAKLCRWPDEDLHIQNVECLGGGNVVSMRLHHQHCSELIEYMGRLGVTAEKVARSAIDATRRYQVAKVPVGEHLADQLLLPMAIGKGGEFRTLKPSRHTLTNMAVIERFMDRCFATKELSKDRWEIELT